MPCNPRQQQQLSWRIIRSETDGSFNGKVHPESKKKSHTHLNKNERMMRRDWAAEMGKKTCSPICLHAKAHLYSWKKWRRKKCVCTWRRIVCGVCVWARHRGLQAPPSLIDCWSGILDLGLSKLIEYYFQEDAVTLFFNLHFLWNQLSYCHCRSVFPGENGIRYIVVVPHYKVNEWYDLSFY